MTLESSPIKEAPENNEQSILEKISILLKQVHFDTYSISKEDKETQPKVLAELQALDEAIMKVSPEMRGFLLSPGKNIETLSIKFTAGQKTEISQLLSKRNGIIQKTLEKTELEKGNIARIIERFTKGKIHLSDEQKENLDIEIENLNLASESVMIERMRSAVILYIIKSSEYAHLPDTLRIARQALLMKLHSAMGPECGDDYDALPVGKDGKPLPLYGYTKTLFELRALRDKLDSEPEETLFTKIFKI